MEQFKLIGKVCFPVAYFWDLVLDFAHDEPFFLQEAPRSSKQLENLLSVPLFFLLYLLRKFRFCSVTYDFR